MKSLINRRAAKAADSMWRRSGMFSKGSSARKSSVRPAVRDREHRQKSEKTAGFAVPTQANEACPGFIKEKGSCYPLCDNPACSDKYKCNLSAHMTGPYDEM